MMMMMVVVVVMMIAVIWRIIVEKFVSQYEVVYEILHF